MRVELDLDQEVRQVAVEHYDEVLADLSRRLQDAQDMACPHLEALGRLARQIDHVQEAMAALAALTGLTVRTKRAAEDMVEQLKGATGGPAPVVMATSSCGGYG